MPSGHPIDVAVGHPGLVAGVAAYQWEAREGRDEKPLAHLPVQWMERRRSLVAWKAPRASSMVRKSALGPLDASTSILNA